MTAPAVQVAPPVVRHGRVKAGVDRWNGVVEAWLRGHAAIVYAFLYLPIVIVVIYSFNANRLATIWTSFTFDWYQAAMPPMRP